MKKLVKFFMGGLSLIGGSSANADARKQNRVNAEMEARNKITIARNLETIKEDNLRTLGVDLANIDAMKNNLSHSLGQALMKGEYEKLRANASIETSLVERNIVGNSAYRAMNTAGREAQFKNDDIIYQVEAQMVSLQEEVSSAYYKQQHNDLQAVINKGVSPVAPVHQEQSTIGLIGNALGTAFQFA